MLSEPENYGLSSEQTLAHTCATRQPDDFDVYWKTVREEVAGLPCGTLELDHEGSFRFRSVRDVTIEGQVLPASPSDRRGVVLELHGAETEGRISTEPPPWSELGLTTLRIRVRGFPPSEVEHSCEIGPRWLCGNVGAADSWIVRNAVADVMQAARIARIAMTPGEPLSIVGPSLGGGLAVMAVAQLTCMSIAVDRLVLDLPSLGDWAWRSDRYSNGLGGPLVQLIDVLRGADRDALVASLAYCDAALHAETIRCPVLCHLAELDDVVPAPTAAAICNALGSSQIERVITRYGHFDGGLRHAREIAAFRQVVPRFLAAELSENLPGEGENR